VRKSGLRVPLLFKERDKLGMTLPEAADFTVNEVLRYIGKNRIVDVMDCSTQAALQMRMEDWVAYYTDPDKVRLLNVLSLEFSQSRLSRSVRLNRRVCPPQPPCLFTRQMELPPC
jgi:F-box/leucine-rich repeat protein 10/11